MSLVRGEDGDDDAACSGGEGDDCPGTDNIVSTADRAAGNMHANPMSARYPLGFTAYTCFQMIQAPNPIKTYVSTRWRSMDCHFTFSLASVCLLPDTRLSDIRKRHFPDASSPYVRNSYLPYATDSDVRPGKSLNCYRT